MRLVRSHARPTDGELNITNQLLCQLSYVGAAGLPSTDPPPSRALESIGNARSAKRDGFKVAALYVDKRGPYSEIPWVDCWGRHVNACKSCGASIVWALANDGKRIPIDESPVPDGNLVLWVAPEDMRTIRVRSYRADNDSTGGLGPDRFTAHFATCPNAKK